MALKKPSGSTTNDVSMLLGIAVSEKASKNAIHAPDNAVAEVNLDENTQGVRVKKYTKVRGLPFLVGMECNCNGSMRPTSP